MKSNEVSTINFKRNILANSYNLRDWGSHKGVPEDSSLLGCYQCRLLHTVETRYNDIGLYDASSIAPDVLWYQLIPHC
jgi:hypothetical protein